MRFVQGRGNLVQRIGRLALKASCLGGDHCTTTRKKEKTPGASFLRVGFYLTKRGQYPIRPSDNGNWFIFTVERPSVSSSLRPLGGGGCYTRCLLWHPPIRLHAPMWHSKTMSMTMMQRPLAAIPTIPAMPIVFCFGSACNCFIGARGVLAGKSGTFFDSVL